MHMMFQLADGVFSAVRRRVSDAATPESDRGERGAPEVDSRFQVWKAKAHHFEHPVCTQKALGDDDAVLRE
jgi:hypothetical protein